MVSTGSTMMTSQSMPSETIVVLTSNDIKFPQTEKPKRTDQTQDRLKKHLKAEIKVLATIQILCGVMVLSVGLILVSAPFSGNFTPVFSILLKAVYPFAGTLCFIVSGSLSIIKEKKSTKSLVQASLIANILSSLFALEGLVLLLFNLAALGPVSQRCDLEQKDATTPHYFYHFHNDRVDRECSMASASLAGLLSVMLICTVMELCLAMLAIVLWWKQAHSNFPGRVLFLPQSYKNTSGMVAEAHCSSGYEELLTS